MKINLHTSAFCALLLLLLSFAACRHSEVPSGLFAQVDSVMNTHPDSALRLLKTIAEPQKLNRASAARYALLMTQAEDKNWIPMKNDSLIQVAVDYYKEDEDRELAAKAYYYLGCVKEDMEDMVGATDAFLLALKTMPKETRDVERMVMIYSSLARNYLRQGFYDESLEMYRAANSINEENKRLDKLLFSMQGLSNVLVDKEQWDSAVYYGNRIVETSRAIGDSSWVGIGFNILAHIYYYQEMDTDAFRSVSQSIQKLSTSKKENENYKIGSYQLLSNLYTQMGQYDSARYYLSLCTNQDDINTRAISNWSLYELEKSCGRYKEAVQYNDIYQALADSIQEKKRKAEVAKLMNDYTVEKYKREIRRKQKQHTRMLVYAFVFIVVASLFTFLMIDRQRKQKYARLQRSLMKKRGEMMRVQEELDNLNADKKTDQEVTLEQENKRKLLQALQAEKFQCGVQLFETTPYFKTIRDLGVRWSPEEKVFTAKERNSLCEAIYEIFADTMSDLKDQCPDLTREEIFYCVFYLQRYSNSQIMACTGTNANALKTRKSRIKSKLDEELRVLVLGDSK